MSGASFRLRDVVVSYGDDPALRGISGTFAPGSLTALVGPNGAGKTTLLKAMLGLLPLAGGTVEIKGVASQDVGYLPQLGELDRKFPINVFDVVAMGHWRRCGWFGGLTRAQGVAVEHALESVGLGGKGQAAFGALSAGQMRRALFARVMVQDPAAILLDEPFAAMDAGATADLLALVRRWHGEGRTVIAAMHDLQQVQANFPATLLLARELVAWGDTARVLTPENVGLARARLDPWSALRPVTLAHAA
jgi:zinc/manganese transport system ATP-binding protein